MITIVIPFCKKDAAAAIRLIDWIAELGGCPDHDCLIIAARPLVETESATAKNIFPIINSKAFKSVKVIPQSIVLPDESHPIGPNLMFETAAKHFFRIKSPNPWLWMEPDAVPIRSDWMKQIQSAYDAIGNKTILAAVARLGDERFPREIPSGIAVYPPEAWRLYGRLQTNRKVAWDIQFAKHVMPMVSETKLIQTILSRTNPPTFIKSRVPHMARNQMALTDIADGTAIFHPSKDGTLIELLRKKRTPEAPKFVMPKFVDHDPLMMAAPDQTHDGSPWNMSDYMATVPIIRVPRTAPKVSKRHNRIIHVVQRWKPNDTATDRRIHIAMLSWLKIYAQGDVIPRHVWAPFDRDATSLGDTRNLPFMKDILQTGMMTATQPDDIILLTNDDSVLHPDIANVIFERLKKAPCLCAGRMHYSHPDKPDFTARDWPMKSKDIGRDAFAFRMDWLKEEFDKMPDMVLCDAQFDLVLGTMVRMANGVAPTRETRVDANPKAELPYGYVQHEAHKPGWIDKPTNGQKHNYALAAKWYRDNKLGHMVDFL